LKIRAPRIWTFLTNLDLTIRGGMRGKETLKRLLEIDPEVKAIVASGYSQDPVMQDYQEYGFKGNDIDWVVGGRIPTISSRQQLKR
ncbi:MAG TPA: hypothetical protein VK564_09770, partial [Thermodesulfobacteriota bacterium]|nr:hypothetical protein [Thermodesulfobacteriota bacterium]